MARPEATFMATTAKATAEVARTILIKCMWKGLVDEWEIFFREGLSDRHEVRSWGGEHSWGSKSCPACFYTLCGALNSPSADKYTFLYIVGRSAKRSSRPGCKRSEFVIDGWAQTGEGNLTRATFEFFREVVSLFYV